MEYNVTIFGNLTNIESFITDFVNDPEGRCVPHVLQCPEEYDCSSVEAIRITVFKDAK